MNTGRKKRQAHTQKRRISFDTKWNKKQLEAIYPTGFNKKKRRTFDVKKDFGRSNPAKDFSERKERQERRKWQKNDEKSSCRVGDWAIFAYLMLTLLLAHLEGFELVKDVLPARSAPEVLLVQSVSGSTLLHAGCCKRKQQEWLVK